MDAFWQALDHLNAFYALLTAGGAFLASIAQWLVRMFFADRKSTTDIMGALTEIRDSQKISNRRLSGAVAMLLDLYSDEKEPFFRADEFGSLNFVNQALCDLIGRPAEMLMGRGWASFVYVEDRAIVEREWQSAIDAQRTYLGWFRVKDNRNAVVPVSLDLRPLRCELKVVTGYAGRITVIKADA